MCDGPDGGQYGNSITEMCNFFEITDLRKKKFLSFLA